MSDTKTPDQSELLQVIASLQSQMSEIKSGGGRRRGPEYKITSVSIPVLIKDRGDKIRVYLNCECKVESEEDILDLCDELQSKLPVEFWKERSSDRVGRSVGNDYGRGGNRR